MYHKRYLTSDTGYYVIEGVGSSRGLFPDYIAPVGLDRFFCFHYCAATFTPNSVIPCTYVSRFDPFGEGIAALSSNINVNIYPNPTNNFLNIAAENDVELTFVVYGIIGEVVGKGHFRKYMQIDCSNCSSGLNYVELTGDSVNKVTIPFFVCNKS
jgi:hypothetical protein